MLDLIVDSNLFAYDLFAILIIRVTKMSSGQYNGNIPDLSMFILFIGLKNYSHG